MVWKAVARWLGCAGGSAYHQGKHAADAVYQLAYDILKDKLDSLLANDHACLNQEYSSLGDVEVAQTQTVDVAETNACKNRYANVLPFDYNRVKISGEDDYINASTIQQQDGEVPAWKYIAAQGPLASTVADFWTMVLEKNCSVIIMLTRTIENNHIKCADYFSHPVGETAKYGDYRVTTTSAEQVTQDITRRMLQLKHHKTQQVHQVAHYHYHRWPDFGVPCSTEPIRRLVRLLWEGSSHQGQEGVLVHCSAGIGRTGTLMAIDIVLRRLWAMAEGSDPPSPAAVKLATDLPSVVAALRKQRKGMVQTAEQYLFCYQALLEEAKASLSIVPGPAPAQLH